jgi:hypothetical protein
VLLQTPIFNVSVAADAVSEVAGDDTASDAAGALDTATVSDAAGVSCLGVQAVKIVRMSSATIEKHTNFFISFSFFILLYLR